MIVVRALEDEAEASGGEWTWEASPKKGLSVGVGRIGGWEWSR